MNYHLKCDASHRRWIVMEFKHKSVLLEETIENLNIKPDGIYVDGTVGGGGHALEVCRRLSDKGRFIGFDQDADAIQAAGERLAGYADQVTIIRSNYCRMAEELKKRNIICGWYFTGSGVSSYQLDNAREDLRIGKMRRWTCVWTKGRSVLRLIL